MLLLFTSKKRRVKRVKFQKNNKYFTIALYAFGVIAASIAFIFVLLYPNKLLGGISSVLSILSPLIVGFLLAFILNPLLKLFEKKAFKKILNKKEQLKTKRVLSMICTYLVFLGIITLFIVLIIPSIAQSITDLANNIQGYYNSGIALITDLLIRFNVSDELVNYFNDLGSDIINLVLELLKNVSTYMPKIFDVAASATTFLKNIVVGFAFSIYMLSSKETFKRQTKKVLSLIAKPQTQERFIRVAHMSHETFSRYLSGYLLDSTVVGIVCYIVMLIFGWPYPALISVIIGITNMIPFFGPFIGAIPSALLILLVNPWEALFFGIFIVILQQVDGNFICPKVLGQRVGLSSFWVMVAIVVGGSLFGVAGLILSVPALAVIYTLTRSYVNRKLSEKAALDAEEESDE